MIFLFLCLSSFPAFFQSSAASRAAELIDSYLASGRVLEAEELLERILKEPASPLETDREIAAACVRQGHAALAARYLERARQRHSASILMADLASAYYLAGEYARTASTLDEMARRTKLPPAVMSLRGLAALRLGKRSEALAHLRAAAAEPNEGTANFYLGTLAAESGDLTRAIRHLEIAARTYRDRNSARYNLALVLYRAERWLESVKLLEKLAAEEPTAEVHNLLAHGYDKLDLVKEALDAYQKAIRQAPKNPSYVFDFGLMALRRRTYDLAEIVLTAGLKSFPGNRNLALALGATHQVRGQMEKAQQTFQALLANSPRDSLVYLYLGNSYFAAGRFEDAVKAFAQGMEIDPANGLFPYQTAVSLIKLGEESDRRVQKLLEKALELDPKLSSAYYHLAKLAADSDDPGRARELLQRGLKLDPEMSEAHFLLARICRKNGDARCAEAALKRYEELRVRERERLEKDQVLGILFTLEKR